MVARMVARHVGGEAVKGGIYWSIGAGEFISVPAEGGRLAGGPKNRYIKAPLPVVLILGPLMGLAFAIFLPLSGLLVLIPFLVGKLRDAVSSGRVGAAHMATPRMQPGISYLEPRSHGDVAQKGSKSQPPEGGQTGKLVDLAREIAEKRWKDK